MVHHSCHTPAEKGDPISIQFHVTCYLFFHDSYSPYPPSRQTAMNRCMTSTSQFFKGYFHMHWRHSFNIVGATCWKALDYFDPDLALANQYIWMLFPPLSPPPFPQIIALCPKSGDLAFPIQQSALQWNQVGFWCYWFTQLLSQVPDILQ